jgi:hypothetical protein
MTAWGDLDTHYAFLSKRRMELIVKGIWFVLTVATVRSHWRGTWKGLNNYLEIGI